MSNLVTDVIIILDESGSMEVMGKEAIQSANVFIKQQKTNCDDKSTITVVSFNFNMSYHIDDKPLSTVELLDENKYIPQGGTALNDAICKTVKKKLKSVNPNNTVLVIITDGEENSSQIYTLDDTKKLINLVETEHDWKVVFIGANIDVFSEGTKMSVNTSRCAQFDQRIQGNLTELCRHTSIGICNYRKSRTEGDNVDLCLSPLPKR